MTKILLAIDGSDASMAAVATTAALSRPPDTLVEVVSVVPDTFAPEGSVWPNVVRIDPPSDRVRVIDDVALRLEDIAARLRDRETRVDVRVLEGRPATEIVAEATRVGADLIVMGARGLSAVRRLLLGSVSSEVVDDAPCPVLIARRGDVERVMIATDGSPASADAVEFLADSGLFEAARIRVVSATDPGIPVWTGISPVDGATSIEVYNEAVVAADARARDAARRAAERLGDLEVEGVSALPHGDVVGAILDAAAAGRADLIVMGARPMGTVRRWLVGSVSRSVLHLADASILIVRRRSETASEAELAATTTA